MRVVIEIIEMFLYYAFIAGNKFQATCLAICMLIVYLPAYNQESKQILFKDLVYSKFSVEKNISYLGDLKTDRKLKYYTLDLYSPKTDSKELKPLIIWLHGGGFKFGTKKSKGTPLWAKNFARRGYVCAAINYRLSKKNTLFDFTDLVEGCKEAIRDTRHAISFLKASYQKFGIDTNFIILAGNSAGGMIAIQSVYATEAELNRLINRNDSGPVKTSHNPDRIAAVVNFWGAVFDTSWLKNSKTPVVSVHGTKDRVVPFMQKSTPIWGSYFIHEKLDQLNTPNKLKAYEGYGHELQKHFNPIFSGRPAKKRWREAADFTAGFLYQELFR